VSVPHDHTRHMPKQAFRVIGLPWPLDGLGVAAADLAQNLIGVPIAADLPYTASGLSGTFAKINADFRWN
jgi:hypothetical protein